MSTTIYSNGGNGNCIEDIVFLLERLSSYPLDPSFDAGDCLYEFDGVLHRFFGNFATYSHVFRITTTDIKLAIRLRMAISKNLRSEAFKVMRDHFGIHQRKAMKKLQKHTDKNCRKCL